MSASSSPTASRRAAERELGFEPSLRARTDEGPRDGRLPPVRTARLRTRPAQARARATTPRGTHLRARRASPASSAARASVKGGVEAIEIELLRLENEGVPGRARLQGPRGQQLAQVRDVDLHHLLSRFGHVDSPERHRRSARARACGWHGGATGPGAPAPCRRAAVARDRRRAPRAVQGLGIPSPAARTYHGVAAIYRPPTREQPSASRVPLSLLLLAQLAKGEGNGDKETTRSRRLPGRQRRVVPLPPRGTGGRDRTLARPRRGGGRSERLDRAGRAATDDRRPRRDRDCAHAGPAGCAAGTRAAAARRLDPARVRLPRKRRRARHRTTRRRADPSRRGHRHPHDRGHARRRRVGPSRAADGHPLLGADRPASGVDLGHAAARRGRGAKLALRLARLPARRRLARRGRGGRPQQRASGASATGVNASGARRARYYGAGSRQRL